MYQILTIPRTSLSLVIQRRKTGYLSVSLHYHKAIICYWLTVACVSVLCLSSVCVLGLWKWWVTRATV